MVMVDFSVEQPFHRVNDLPGADERAIDVVVQRIADREPDDTPFAIATAGGLLHHLMLGTSNPAEQVDFLAAEQTVNDQEAVPLEPGELRIAQSERHGDTPPGDRAWETGPLSGARSGLADREPAPRSLVLQVRSKQRCPWYNTSSDTPPGCIAGAPAIPESREPFGGPELSDSRRENSGVSTRRNSVRIIDPCGSRIGAGVMTEITGRGSLGLPETTA